MVSIKPALTLFTLIAVSALLLGILYDVTREPIRQQQIIRETEMIALLLPGTAQVDEEYLDIPSLIKIVTGYDNQREILGYVVTAYAPGYAGPVEIMAGFDTDGVLMGVQILSQRETPGLGTAILNADFLGQFPGRTSAMTVVRMATAEDEIQALTSATISTEAVVNAINAAMAYIIDRLN